MGTREAELRPSSIMERTVSVPNLSLDKSRICDDVKNFGLQEQREYDVDSVRQWSNRQRQVERMSITMCALHHEVFHSMDDMVLPHRNSLEFTSEDGDVLRFLSSSSSSPKSEQDSIEKNKINFLPIRSQKKDAGNIFKKKENQRRQLWISLFAVVFFGCAAVVPTELAVRRRSDAMSFITLTNYILVSTETWLDRGYSLLKERRIPLQAHLVIFVLGLCYNFTQNKAIANGLPISLVLILKNSQIIFQMVANFCFLGERYLFVHEVSAFIVIIGVLIVLGASANFDVFLFLKQRAAHRVSNDEEEKVLFFQKDDQTSQLYFGICLMITAVSCRAVSNVCSQAAFLKRGNHYSEKLFYEHALGLPLLLFPYFLDFIHGNTINKVHDNIMPSERDDDNFPILPSHIAHSLGLASYAQMPAVWMLVLLQAFCTWECTRSCERVVGLSGGLSLAIVLVFQRFISTLFSAIILNKPAALLALWIGSLLVLFGVTIYVIAPKPKRRPGAVGACFAYLAQ